MESVIYEIILDDGQISSFLQQKTQATRLSMGEMMAARDRAANKFLAEDDEPSKVEHDTEGMGAVSNLLRWGFGRLIKRVEPENENVKEKKKVPVPASEPIVLEE
jgi:hypothetical protein